MEEADSRNIDGLEQEVAETVLALPKSLSAHTDPAFLEAAVEAMLFAYGEPLEINQIIAVAACSEEEVAAALERIESKYQEENFGFELIKVAGGYQFRTKNRFADYLRELKADKPRRLSAAALETLSVVAYRQPVVKSDIEKIRGVDVTPTLKTLLERNLVKIVGHQPTVGQPALYGTTDEFLKLFGLDSLSQLPSLADLKEFEKDPGETADPGEVAEAQGEGQASDSGASTAAA